MKKNTALINWNKYELWVVSVVKGIKNPKKKIWQAESVYKEKIALIKAKCFNKKELETTVAVLLE